MAISLHPWVIGQPYRIGALEAALAHIMGHQGVWAATGAQIVDAWRSQQRDERLQDKQRARERQP